MDYAAAARAGRLRHGENRLARGLLPSRHQPLSEVQPLLQLGHSTLQGIDVGLLIVERLLPSAPEPSPVHLMDLNMLVLAGGRERSREEFETLLSSAGYRLERIMPLPHFLNLIEAVRV